MVDKLGDLEQKIDGAHAVLNDDDSTHKEKEEAKDIISKADEITEKILSDLTTEAASVPGVDVNDLSNALTDAAAEASGGELPPQVDNVAAKVEDAVEEQEKEQEDALNDLANVVTSLDGVNENELAKDILAVVKDATDGDLPSDLSNIVGDLEDVQNKIEDAQDVLKDDDASKKEKEEAKDIIAEGSEEKQQLLADLTSEASSVPGVDAQDLTGLLTSTAQDSNGGELPPVVATAVEDNGLTVPYGENFPSYWADQVRLIYIYIYIYD